MKQTPSRAGKVAVRLFIASIAILALGGPSPGHVGSCDGSAERTPYPEFCERYQTYACQRDYDGGRLDIPGYTACAADAGMGCSAGNYMECNGVPTEPTQTQTDACLAAMQDPARYSLLASELIECRFSDCGGI